MPDYEWNFGENWLHPVVYGVVLVAAGRARRCSERGSVTSTAGWGGTAGDSKPTTVNWGRSGAALGVPARDPTPHAPCASFKRWLTDTVFSLAYEPAGQPETLQRRARRCPAFPEREFTASIAKMAKRG